MADCDRRTDVPDSCLESGLGRLTRLQVEDTRGTDLDVTPGTGGEGTSSVVLLSTSLHPSSVQ